jgi:hypothetical protein
MRNALVDREQHIVPGNLRFPQKLSILETLEPRPLRRVNLMTRQVPPEVDR